MVSGGLTGLSPSRDERWRGIGHRRRCALSSRAGASTGDLRYLFRASAVKPVHILMAVAVAAIWGFNFVAIRWGLDSFPPILLACLRFAVAALPALVVPRPEVAWARLVAIGTAWFVAQFALLFIGMQAGMPPGLASVVMQAQAFFTILFAALALGERPRARHLAGMAVAACGVVAIGASAGGQ